VMENAEIFWGLASKPNGLVAYCADTSPSTDRSRGRSCHVSRLNAHAASASSCNFLAIGDCPFLGLIGRLLGAKQQKETGSKNASAANRTRGLSMATMNFITKQLTLFSIVSRDVVTENGIAISVPLP
jgi:hypothetical protein